MGTNNLETKNPGDVIASDDPNQYKTALGVDHVPRNSSGVPTDLAGTSGSTIYRWLVGYFQKVVIGAIASSLSIEESSGDMIFKVGGSTVATLKSTGLTRASIIKNYGESSGSSTFSTTSTSFVDVTNLSKAITTLGGKVKVSIISLKSAAPVTSVLKVDTTTGDNSINATFEIQRDSTTIATFGIQVMATNISNLLATAVPPPGLVVVDNPGAGAYTYKMRAKLGTGDNVYVTDVILAVEEM